MDHATDVGLVGIHRGVHIDDGALNWRQLALAEDPVEADPDDRFGGMVAKRRAAGEVHLVFPRHSQADVPVRVRRDRPACDDAPGDLDDLVDHFAVHLFTPHLLAAKRHRSVSTTRGRYQADLGPANVPPRLGPLEPACGRWHSSRHQWRSADRKGVLRTAVSRRKGKITPLRTGS